MLVRGSRTQGEQKEMKKMSPHPQFYCFPFFLECWKLELELQIWPSNYKTPRLFPLSGKKLPHLLSWNRKGRTKNRSNIKHVSIIDGVFFPFHSVLWEMKMFKKSQKLEIMLQLGRYVSIDVTQHFGNNFKIFFKKKTSKKTQRKIWKSFP